MLVAIPALLFTSPLPNDGRTRVEEEEVVADRGGLSRGVLERRNPYIGME